MRNTRLQSITSNLVVHVSHYSLRVADIEMNELMILSSTACTCVYFAFFTIFICGFIIQPLSCNFINKIELSCLELNELQHCFKFSFVIKQ